MRPTPEPPKARRVLLRSPGLSIALGFCLIFCWDGSRASAQLLNPERRTQLSSVEPEVSKPTLLDRIRSYLPEWLAMAAEILHGDPIQPGKGWFARGKSLTRFTWVSVAARLDGNRDGSISREEFPGPAPDFHRLDRDGSQTITAADFEFPSNALAMSRSKMIMSFADRNHDGKVQGTEYSQMLYLATRDQITRHANFADAISEVEKAYEASMKDGQPYMTASDFRSTVDLAAKSKSHMLISNPDNHFEIGSRATLFKALIRREIGVLRAGPSPGDQAPDFTLPTDDGRGRVTLSKLLGKRPVVLIFANYTSPGFRVEAGTLDKLAGRYRSRAEFFMVYVREQHPSDGWVAKENARSYLGVPQPTSDQERLAVAQLCRKKLGLALPMVVDSVDDRVGILYSGMPDRLYLLDPRGIVVAKSGRGPFGFKPDEIEQSLLLLLQAEAAPSSAAAPPRTP